MSAPRGGSPRSAPRPGGPSRPGVPPPGSRPGPGSPRGAPPGARPGSPPSSRPPPPTRGGPGPGTAPSSTPASVPPPGPPASTQPPPTSYPSAPPRQYYPPYNPPQQYQPFSGNQAVVVPLSNPRSSLPTSMSAPLLQPPMPPMQPPIQQPPPFVGPQHSGRSGSPPKRSASPTRRDPQYSTHDHAGPPVGSKAATSTQRSFSPQSISQAPPAPNPGPTPASWGPSSNGTFGQPVATSTFQNPPMSSGMGTFRDPVDAPQAPPPAARVSASSPSLQESLNAVFPESPLLSSSTFAILPTTPEATYDLFTQQKKQTEKLKAECQAIREARELEFLRAHKELESLKMQQAIDAARLESKKRECEQGIERLRNAQRQSEVSLQRLKAERELSRQKEEQTTRQLNEKLGVLEQQREMARQRELEEIRRKIRDQTARQNELANEKLNISAGLKENEIIRREHDAKLRYKEQELAEKEAKLNREWEDIERRRIALEALSGETSSEVITERLTSVGATMNVKSISSPTPLRPNYNEALSPRRSPMVGRYERVSITRERSPSPTSSAHTHTSARDIEVNRRLDSRAERSPSPVMANDGYGRSLQHLRAENELLREKIERIDREADLDAVLIREREVLLSDPRDAPRPATATRDWYDTEDLRRRDRVQSSSDYYPIARESPRRDLGYRA